MKNNLLKRSLVLGIFALMFSLNVKSQCAATFTMGPSAPLTWTISPTYAANTASNATWIWGDGNWSIGLYPSHTYTASGVYTICVVTNNTAFTCTSTTCDSSFIYKVQTQAPIQISVIGSATGINEVVNAQSLSMYPNPSTGKVTIQAQKENGTVNVYNVLGVKVKEISVQRYSDIEIDLSSLENGIYSVEFDNGKAIMREKVILNK